MNSSHNPQRSHWYGLFNVFGLCSAWILMDAIPVAADSALAPETAAVLDLLRSRVASGLAGQESYDAFIDFLAENGAGSGTD